MSIPYRVSVRSPITTGEVAHGISVPALTLAREGGEGRAAEQVFANGSQNESASRYSYVRIAAQAGSIDAFEENVAKAAAHHGEAKAGGFTGAVADNTDDRAEHGGGGEPVLVHRGEADRRGAHAGKAQGRAVERQPVGDVGFVAVIGADEGAKVVRGRSRGHIAAKRFDRYKVDLTKYGSPEADSSRKRYAIAGVPTIVFLAADGQEIPHARVEGFLAVEPFLERLKLGEAKRE